MGFDDEGKIDVDPDVVKTLRYRILLTERENHKTQKYKDNEMVDRIRKLIEFEVDKNDHK